MIVGNIVQNKSHGGIREVISINSVGFTLRALDNKGHRKCGETFTVQRNNSNWYILLTKEEAEDLILRTI